MKISQHQLKKWGVLLLCVLILITSALPVAAASGKVSSVSVTNATNGAISLNKGKSLTLKVSVKGTGSFSKAVAFKSSNTKVVSVTSNGVIKGLKAGTAKITVTSKAKTSVKTVVKVTVKTPVTKVKLNKTKATLVVKKTLQLKATISPSNASNKKVSWKSSNKSVATVSSSGKVTAKKAGKATITATAKDGSKKKATCVITVKPLVSSVKMNIKSKTLKVNDTLQLETTIMPSNAGNKKVTWKSSNTSVATVSSSGKVTAKKAGKATITATAKDGSKKKATCKITVVNPVASVELNSSSENMNVDETIQLVATVSPSDASNKAVTFTSSDPQVASVDNEGNVKALMNGTAVITVTTEDGGKTAQCTITVTTSVESVALGDEPITLSVNKNPEYQLTPVIYPETASNKNVTYSSSAPEVASVDENGTIKALSKGTAIITVTTEDGGLTSSCEVTVRSLLESITINGPERMIVGTEEQLTINIEPADADLDTIHYSVDAPEAAQVSEDGKITALANGTVKITASASDIHGNEATCEKEIIVWTPVSEVRIEPEAVVLYEGEERQIIVTVLPEEASMQKVSYTSDHTDVASVSESGLIKAVAEGNAVITVMSEDGEHSAQCSVEVKKIQTAATVESQTELENALLNDQLQFLSIVTEDSLQFTIAEGSYANVALTVDAPNAHIENHAVFKNIVIKGISASTFAEYAVGNNFIYKAPIGRITTEEGAVLNTLTIEEGAGKLDFVNNGDISDILLSTTASLNISGHNEGRINLTAAPSAVNSVVVTSVTLKVEAKAVIELSLQAGSENTIVNVDKKENIPKLTGIGETAVTSRDTGVTEYILSEPTAESSEKTLAVTGTVKDVNGTGIEGASIAFIPYKATITEETMADEVANALTVATTDSSGNYKSDLIPIGNYYAYVTAEGYQPVSRKVSINSTYDDIYPFSEITMLPDTEEETENGGISGILTDARTNEPVSAGITVRLREGADNKSGDYLYETMTDENGAYTFSELPAGQYTVQVLDLRNEEAGYYITAFISVTVSGGNIAESRYPIRYSANTAGNQITFTLTWGDSDSGASKDLDSHLTGPTPDGGEFHTWYSNEYYYYTDSEGTSTRYVFLDYDDTTWEGPENTTIEKSVDGIYHFFVHDYSNGSNPLSDQMSKSAAVVTVSSSESVIGTYYVPNEVGTLWHVCDYNSATGRITAVNKVYRYEDNESDIGTDLYQKYTQLLSEYLQSAESYKEILDADSLAILEEAQRILNDSDDVNEIMAAYHQVRNIVDDLIDSLKIEYIYGDDVARYEYSADEIPTGDVELKIVGYAAELVTENINVDTHSDSSYTWETDNINPDARMIVVTSERGIVCRYHVTYVQDTTNCEIKSVTAFKDDYNLISDWYTDSTYTSDDEEINILSLECMSTSIPEGLTITPVNHTATVSAVTESDLEGYQGKVTVSTVDNTKTYYIRLRVSTKALPISNVNAMAGEYDLLSDWDTSYHYETDDVRIDILEVYSFTSDVLNNLTITPELTSVTVGEITASDRSEYDGMVTLTLGDFSTVYYIKLYISKDVFSNFYIESYDAEDNYLAADVNYFPCHSPEGIDYVTISGSSAGIPEKIKVFPYSSSLTAGEVVASDLDAYDAMFEVTYMGYKVKWYIIYKSEALTISDIWGDSISGYEYSKEEIATGDVELTIRSLSKEISTDSIGISLWTGESNWTWETDNLDADSHMIVVTASDGRSCRYHVKFKPDANNCDITEITAMQDDTNLISDWYRHYGYVYDDDDEEIEIKTLVIYGAAESLPTNLVITPRNEYAEVSAVTESEYSRFSGKVTVSAAENSITYYIKWNSTLDTSLESESIEENEDISEESVMAAEAVTSDDSPETSEETEHAEEAAEPAETADPSEEADEIEEEKAVSEETAAAESDEAVISEEKQETTDEAADAEEKAEAAMITEKTTDDAVVSEVKEEEAQEAAVSEVPQEMAQKAAVSEEKAVTAEETVISEEAVEAAALETPGEPAEEPINSDLAA